MKRWRWLWIPDDRAKEMTLGKLIRILNERLKALADFLSGAAGDGLYAAEGFFYNNGNVLGAGDSDWLDIPSNFEITAAEIVADQVGDITVEVWISSYGSWDTFTKISGSNPITLSGAKKNQVVPLSGWTTTFSGGRYLKYVITGVPSGITKATVTLTLAAPIGLGEPQANPTGPAGGVLGGTYPDPTFAVDMATQAELDAEAAARAAADTAAIATAEAYAVQRANHTGTQLASTISDFNSASRAQTEAELVAGSNITITPGSSGATRTLTIASSGGTSIGVTPETQPASPNAADDEFEGGSLDTAGTRRVGATAWAWQNQGTATAVHTRGAVNLLAVAGGGGTMNARYILESLPAGDWTYEAHLFVDGGSAFNTWGFGGFALRESSTAKALLTGIGDDSGMKAQVRRLTGDTTWTANPASSTTEIIQNTREFFVRISRSGTTIAHEFGFSGVYYHPFYSAVQTTDFTTAPNQIGLVASAPTAGGANVSTVGFWFRRTA